MILFALAGALATVVDYFFYWLSLKLISYYLPFVKYSYLPASCVGFIFGILVSYFISIKFIFQNRNIKNPKLELLVFTIIGVVGLIFTQLFMYLFNEIYPFKELTNMLTNLLSPIGTLKAEWSSKIIVTIIVFFWNFFARKVIMFNDKKI